MVWLKYYRASADYGIELCYQLRFKTVCNGLAEILSGMGGLWKHYRAWADYGPGGGLQSELHLIVQEKRQISILKYYRAWVNYGNTIGHGRFMALAGRSRLSPAPPKAAPAITLGLWARLWPGRGATIRGFDVFHQFIVFFSCEESVSVAIIFSAIQQRY